MKTACLSVSSVCGHRAGITFALSLLSLVSAVQAQITWTGGGSDYYWSTGANWSGGAAPTNGAAVLFGSYPQQVNIANTGSLSLSSLTFQSAAPRHDIFIWGGNQLTLSGTGIVNSSSQAQVLHVEGGSTSGAPGATLTLNSAAVTANGTYPSPNYFSANNGYNGGQAGQILFNGNTNAPSAIVQTTSDALFDISGLSSAGTEIGGLYSSGTLNLGGKTLTLGAFLPYGFTASGMVVGDGGSLIKKGVSSFTLSGTGAYTGATAVKGGTMTISGSLVRGTGIGVDSGATLNLASTSTVLVGTTNTLNGTVNYSGPGQLLAESGTTTNNTGVFYANGTVAQSIVGSGTFNNSGIFSKATSNQLEVTGLAALNNTGTFNVNAGTLTSRSSHFVNAIDGAKVGLVNVASGATFAVDSQYTNRGRTTVASGGAIVFAGTDALINEGTLTVNSTGGSVAAAGATFNGGSYQLKNGSLINGTGSAVFTSNVYTISDTATVAVAQSTWQGGDLRGDGAPGADTLIQSGTATVTGGLTLNAGVTLSNTGTTNIASGGMLIVNGGAVENTGTLAITRDGSYGMIISSGQTVTNASGGTINWTGTGSIVAPGTLNNAAGATLNTGAGASTTQQISGTQLTNRGDVNVQSGTLQLVTESSYAATYTQTAGNLNIAAGATLDVAGTTAATFNGGAIRGNGTLRGDSAFNSGALIAPGNSIGTLTFDGDTIWGSGAGLQLELFSAGATTVPGVANDFVSISGSLQLPASGFTLSLASIGAGGVLTGFDPSNNYNWTIATAGGGISGFTASTFTLVTSGISGAFGTWNVFQSGNDLKLGYLGTLTPVPEPSTYAALSLALCAGFAAWRRRQRHKAATPAVPAPL